MTRRGTLLFIATVLVVGGGVAAAIVLVFTRSSSLTRAEYVGRVNVVCKEMNARLAQIPAPLVGNPTQTAQSISDALPLVEERATRVREIPPPAELEADVDRMFAASDRATALLREAKREGERGDIRASATAFGAFLGSSDEAHQVSLAIGFAC